MAVSLAVNGVSYSFPERRDEDWGINVTAWASAVTAVIATLRTPTIPTATAGQIRLGNTDSLEWRNFADDANLRIYADVDDRLYFQNGAGTPVDLIAAAAGNVTGPVSSTDNALARYDGITGQTLLDSGAILDDSDNLSGLATLSAAVVDAPQILLGAGDVDLEKALVPIGTIIPFYDFNAALTLDGTYWKPCDGGTYTIGGSSRQTPDLSNRYLVGFGTEGGGDNDTAAWSTTPVGAAGHVINIAHTHTGPSHTHTIDSHTHTMANHTHASGSYFACADFNSGTGQLFVDFVSGSFTADSKLGSISDDGASSSSRSSGLNIGGDSDVPSTNTTGGSGTLTSNASGTGATSSSLSSSQSIQPRSILVRWYMRAK